MRIAEIIPVLILLLSPTQAISALSWSDNLLTNPGAETGDLAPWIAGYRVVVSQSQNEHTGMVYPHSGNWFFNTAGARAGSAGTVVIETLYQDVDVSSYAVAIDAGMFMVKANAWLQTEDSPDHTNADYAQLSLYFINESGGQIDALSTGLAQSPNQTWVERIIDGTAPVGTRALRFELLGEKREGGWMNAFFDDANLQVAIPEPTTLCLLGFASLTLLRRRRV